MFVIPTYFPFDTEETRMDFNLLNICVIVQLYFIIADRWSQILGFTFPW